MTLFKRCPSCRALLLAWLAKQGHGSFRCGDCGQVWRESTIVPGPG